MFLHLFLINYSLSNLIYLGWILISDSYFKSKFRVIYDCNWIELMGESRTMMEDPIIIILSLNSCLKRIEFIDI